jgi:hypothetical protein
MTTTYTRRLIAGADLYDALRAEREALPRARCGNFESEALCRLQEAQARRGILGAELVETIYGWSVRYDSGLQNFGILAGPRSGRLDGSLEAAEKFARQWVAEDASRRYVTVTERSEVAA